MLNTEKKLNKYGIGEAIGNLIAAPILGGIIFWSAGRLDLPRVWLFIIITFIALVAGTLVMLKYNPELLNERGAAKKKSGVPVWDKILLGAFGLTGFYATVVVIGFDIRYGWSALSIYWAIPGVLLYIWGLYILFWSMVVNRHFEKTVRIQTERDHQVVTSGPYQIVRHPGYVGVALWILMPPLIVGSLVALIPAVISVALLLVRTHLEDKKLQKELSGYLDYASQVKYRLLPGIW